MKRKSIILLTTLALTLSACGQSEQGSSNEAVTSAVSSAEESSITESSIAESSTEESSSSEDTSSNMDALGSIEVDSGIFNVTLTIPKDYVGESTQAYLDKLAEEYGYNSITLNDDGSATYVMTKAQHKEMLDTYSKQINESLQEMVASENYPNFTDITANENFTEFTITTKSKELDMNESFSSLAFYMYGGLYAIFSGEEVDNIALTFVNADTGEIISTANSSDL